MRERKSGESVVSTGKSSAIVIAKKHELWSYINKISKLYGGDEDEFLRQYAKEVYEWYQDELDVALGCFKEILEYAKAGR